MEKRQSYLGWYKQQGSLEVENLQSSPELLSDEPCICTQGMIVV